MPGSPRDDLVFDDFINIDLNRGMRRLQQIFYRKALQDSGLSLQEWRSLLTVARYGDTHVRELARLASLDATHTGRAALVLEKRGLIRRYADPNDSRRMRLVATAQGHEMVDTIWVKARAIDTQVKDKIGRTRYRALREALKLILEMEHEKEAHREDDVAR
ncbi:MAG: MarR family winged helix-turn-helix transcriptional regulator [Pseudomonadota bacterium]